MTPQEKAIELISTFSLKSHKMSDHSTIYSPTAKLHAKLCCDEILTYSKAHGFIGLTEYWEKIKEEIENL